MYNQYKFNVFCWLIYMCIMMMFWVDCIEEEVNESSLNFQWLRVIKNGFFFREGIICLVYISVPDRMLFICDVFYIVFECYDCNMIVEPFRFELLLKKNNRMEIFMISMFKMLLTQESYESHFFLYFALSKWLNSLTSEIFNCMMSSCLKEILENPG